MRKGIPLLYALLVCGALFILSSHVTFASSTPHAQPKGTAHVAKGNAVKHASEYSDCDAYGAGVWDQNYLLCAVAPYATPCLRIHADDLNSILACVPPGTILHIGCQSDIPNMMVNGNSYWDAVVLNLGTSN